VETRNASLKYGGLFNNVITFIIIFIIFTYHIFIIFLVWIRRSILG
jgi:hypothetical protein